MTLDLVPGATVVVDGCPYTVVQQISFHEIDFRLDVVQLAGATPAHERWLIAALSEPYLMLAQRLEQDWLAPPRTTVVHEGEIFTCLFQGSAHSVRRWQGGRSKEGRGDYALFRANSGRIIVFTGRNEELEAWLGSTLPYGVVGIPKADAGAASIIE
ncbi:MAG: DUF4178 domain-containing protein [Armatimonadota bacterium]